MRYNINDNDILANCIFKTEQAIVYSILLSEHLAFVDEYKNILNQEECVRADRFHFQQDGEYFIIARALLRRILAFHLEIKPEHVQFMQNTHGKPLLKNNRLHFNLTHSGDVALIAISSGRPLGIDIEKISREVEYLELGERFFAIEEIEQLRLANNKQEQAVIFFNLWTRKEAFIKAIGLGLSFSLSKFAVTGLPHTKPKFIRIDDEDFAKQDWQLHSFIPLEGYIAALAMTK